MHVPVRRFFLSFLAATFVTAGAFAQTETQTDPSLIGPSFLRKVPDRFRSLTTATVTGPSGIITTVVGDGLIGSNGNGGPATSAQLIFPDAVVTDSLGNFYISDPWANMIRKVTVSTGVISDYAGSGIAGYSGDGGAATSADIDEPEGIAIDASNNLYIADWRNNVIRKVTAKTGVITTVAGNGDYAGSVVDLQCGAYTSGAKATETALCLPLAVAVDKVGNIYIADEHYRIYKVAASTGIITTFAGTGIYGGSGDGGPAVDAELSVVVSMAVDGSGNLYIADTNNCRIRKVTVSTGIISTFAGGGAGSNGYNCGLSGDGGPAASAQMEEVYGVALDKSNNVYISDTGNQLIRMVSASNGYISTVAGNYAKTLAVRYSNAGYTGDGGPATYAEIEEPYGLAVDTSGNLYYADYELNAVRKVAAVTVLPSEAPSITPAGGNFTPPATITIKPAVTGAVTYYTTDGTLPTTASTKYTGPFSIDKATVVTAFSTISGKPNTTATEAAYLYAPAPTIAPATETITKATSVTIEDADPMAAIYYTTNGTAPSATNPSAQLYASPITISTSTTLQAVAVASANGPGSNAVFTVSSPVTAATYTYDGKPVVVTGAATGITTSGAVLNASVTANNLATQYWFAYGTNSTSLTSSTVKLGPVSSGIATAVTASLTGLKTKTKYYFKVEASNADGSVSGSILNFTTD